MQRKLTWHYLLLAVVLVGVSIVALQQHDTVQLTECLLEIPIYSSATASQALRALVQRSVNATVTAPSQNEQVDELKLDDLIGSFGVEATIYRISGSSGEGNEQENVELEGRLDSPLKLDSNSQLVEGILLIDTSFASTSSWHKNLQAKKLDEYTT